MEHEKRIVHVLIVLVTIAEIGGVIIMSQTAWRVLCQADFNPALVLALSHWSTGAPVCYGSVALLVQCFFAWKIWRLGKEWVWIVLSCVIAALAFLQFSASIAIAVQFAQINRDSLRTVLLRKTVIVQRSGSLACDALITASMIWILWSYKTETSIRSTQRLLNGLIINTLENGAVTTLFVALSLAFYLSYPKNFLNQAFQQAVGRLYSNVFMASLNSRIGRYQQTHVHSMNNIADKATTGGYPKRWTKLNPFRKDQEAGVDDLNVSASIDSCKGPPNA
ncbi:hypothetical protein H1R20_g10728, partial [Candolleomyces eurysporus]